MKNIIVICAIILHVACYASSEFPKTQIFDAANPKDILELKQEERLVLPDDHPIHALDEYSRSPFFAAITKSDDKVKATHVFIAKGASVNLHQPLRVALHYSNLKNPQCIPIVRTLLNAHADINAKDTCRNGLLAPFIWPISFNAKRVKLLLDAKADPNEMYFDADSDDRIAYKPVLHFALQANFRCHKERHIPKLVKAREQVVHMLLDAKADPTLKNSNGISAFGTMSFCSHSIPPSACEKMIRIPHIDSETMQQALGALITHASPEALLLARLHWKPSGRVIQNVLEKNKTLLNFWEEHTCNNEQERRSRTVFRAKKAILQNPHSAELQWARDSILPPVPLDIYFPMLKLSEKRTAQLERETIAAGFTPSKTEPTQNILHKLRAREIGLKNMRFLKPNTQHAQQTQDKKKDFSESKE